MYGVIKVILLFQYSIKLDLKGSLLFLTSKYILFYIRITELVYFGTKDTVQNWKPHIYI